MSEESGRAGLQEYAEALVATGRRVSDAQRALAEADQAHRAVVVAALRAGMDEGEVTGLSSRSQTWVRDVAIHAGIPLRRRGQSGK